MTTTYCTRLNIASLIGEPAVLACIDDDQNGTEDGTESGYVDGAIERAAVYMNEKMTHQYDLANLTTNAWCKWCNAALAAYELFARRGNSPPGSVMESVINYKELLEQIRWGRGTIPEKHPDYDFTPAVSNPIVEMKNKEGPVAIDVEQSVGSTPASGRKRNVAGNQQYSP